MRRFRVWFITDDDEGEQLVNITATDEHSIAKLMAGERKTVIHCQPVLEDSQL